MIKIKCKQCSKHYHKYPSLKGKGYCSRECWHKYLRVNKIHLNTGRTHIKKGQRLSPKTEFKKNKPSWNKGLRGYTHGFKPGKKHWNWKGGITYERTKIYFSEEYVKWRNNVFKRDNYKCKICGKSGKLNADHIKPFSLYPKLGFRLSNGQTLCVNGHKLKTSLDMKLIRKFKYWRSRYV
ncbi:MAG TPA: HNH endonuclease [bacterium]|nr:HNH endonuclease [bacterium]